MAFLSGVTANRVVFCILGFLTLLALYQNTIFLRRYNVDTEEFLVLISLDHDSTSSTGTTKETTTNRDLVGSLDENDGKNDADDTPLNKEDERSLDDENNKKEEENGTPPLNIVLFYADDWSFTTLGAMGNQFVQTPNLDKMTQDGMLFRHNCVTTSTCMISRATLYTGQYASKHKTFFGYKNLTMYEEGKWNQTLFPTLKRNGYHVGLFGKWHHHQPPPRDVPIFDSYKIYYGNHYVNRDGVKRHVTDLNEQDGMEFLRTRPVDKPFAVTIAFYATHAEDGSQEQYRPMNSSMSMYEEATVPHFPTHTDEHWKKMPHFFNDRNFGRGRYMKRYEPEDKFQLMMKNTYRMATEVDTACGRIIEELERQGVLNNTLVIFTTDNGNFHGQHGLAEKWFAYEESLRVPLIILDPRMPADAKGIGNDEFTLNLDLAPTILSAAKIPVPEGMQGRDMAQLYLNPTEAAASWRKEFYYEWFGDEVYQPNNLALVRKDKKYIYWDQFNYEQLFDLVNDPLEERDIFNVTDRVVIDEMRQRMFELQSQAIAGASM